MKLKDIITDHIHIQLLMLFSQNHQKHRLIIVNEAGALYAAVPSALCHVLINIPFFF